MWYVSPNQYWPNVVSVHYDVPLPWYSAISGAKNKVKKEMEISGYTLFTSTETGPIRTMKSTRRAELEQYLNFKCQQWNCDQFWFLRGEGKPEKHGKNIIRGDPRLCKATKFARSYCLSLAYSKYVHTAQNVTLKKIEGAYQQQTLV